MLFQSSRLPKQPQTLPDNSPIGANIDTVVIECCMNCKTHLWNTHHDEERYKTQAVKLAGLLLQENPNVQVLYNQVPGEWFNNRTYSSVSKHKKKWIEYQNNEVYDIQPRMGAFEVSITYNKIERNDQPGHILFFSKLKYKTWPALKSLTTRMMKFYNEMSERMQLQNQYDIDVDGS